MLLKPLKIIQELPDDSTDVECMSLIKNYAARPKQLEAYCLADFAAWFDISSKRAKDNEILGEIENEDDPPLRQTASNEYKKRSTEEDDLHNESYTVGALNFKKKRKAKIIRYVR